MHGRTVLRGGDVFDGVAAPARADVVIEDGVIKAVGAGLDADDEVDVTGCTLMPGVIDAHVHVHYDTVDQFEVLRRPFTWEFFSSVGNLRRTLQAGVTTARDAGGADSGTRAALAKGLIEGPRLQISISMISQTGGHGDPWAPCGMSLAGFGAAHPGRPSGIADGADGLRLKVREMVRAGADVIKVATSGGVLSLDTDPNRAEFSLEEVRAAVEQAAAAGLGLMAHAHGAEGVKLAVRAGARSIEHGVYLDDEAIELMLDKGTYLVPTLSAVRALVDRLESGEIELAAQIVDKVYQVAEAHASSVMRAVAAGIPVALGTDAPVSPHGRNLDELKHLVDHAKLSPLDALTAATSNGAALLGLSDTLGTIEPGKQADLIAVEGSVVDVHALPERIRHVWQAGAPVSGVLPRRSTG